MPSGQSRQTDTMNITLQIPYEKYGTLATLAAAANMPIDEYVVVLAKEQSTHKTEQAKEN